MSRVILLPGEDWVFIKLQFRSHSVLALLTLCFLLAACQQEKETKDVAELTAFATRYAEAWSSQDPEAFASFYTDNGVLIVNDGEASVGRDAIEQTASDYMAAFPDMVVRLVEISQEGDYVNFHWRWTGTNTGPGGTGNAVDLQGYEQWTIGDGGLIRESLGHFDADEYDRQVNAVIE